MAEVTIPTGQSRDGWICISVNGNVQWIKAGEPTELDASEIEVLANAGLTYTSVGVVPGDTPENGQLGSQYFLDGEEVAPTTFYSSAYDAQYHTSEGVVVPAETDSAPNWLRCWSSRTQPSWMVRSTTTMPLLAASF
jgi:hypothetical protein